MDTVVCVASGSSLTEEDCALIENCSYPIISVNTTWERFGRSIVYAGDNSWWDSNYKAIPPEREKWTTAPLSALNFGLNLARVPVEIHKVKLDGYNSGQLAVFLASHIGARRVILCGYDYSLVNGVHWHEDHATRNPVESAVPKWKNQLKKTCQFLKGVEVLNASRYTEIEFLPRVQLEEVL